MFDVHFLVNPSCETGTSPRDRCWAGERAFLVSSLACPTLYLGWALKIIPVASRYPATPFFALKVKLPRLMSHPEDSGGIINRQSAIKQLQKRKELHREKAKHLSEPKSRTS